MQALEESPLVKPLVKFMAGRAEWRGPASDLLASLTRIGGHADSKDWPKQANQLTKKLRRLAPNIRRETGIDVDCDARDATPERNRLVILTRAAGGGKASSAPSGDQPPDPFGPGEAGETDPGKNGRWDCPAPSSYRPHAADETPVNSRWPDGEDGEDGPAPDFAASADGDQETAALSSTAGNEASLRTLRH